MSPPSGPVLAELIDAAGQMLRLTEHHGSACQPEEGGVLVCGPGWRALEARAARLGAALDRAKEA